MRYPRTIRLDQSDTFVFERAAEPGELAVSGAFAFAHLSDDETLTGKPRQAFGSGFLGTDSFGWSTLVAIAEVDEADVAAVMERLADHFLADYGAPDREAALAAARDEAGFAAGLCAQPPNTLLGVERAFGPDGIVERFKVITPSDDFRLGRVWDLVEEGDAP